MRTEYGGGRPTAVTIHTTDLDEAREICGEHLCPRSMRLHDPSARLAARMAFLHLGMVTVADVAYGAEISGASGEFGAYHVNLVLTGRFAAEQAHRPIYGSTRLAGLYGPLGHNVLHYASADCRLLAVRIDRSALEDQVAALLDRPVRTPLRLSGGLDVDSTPGRRCADLIRLLGTEIDNPTGLVHHPIVAAPLAEGLLMLLVSTTSHQYRDALERRQRRHAPHAVRQVIDKIHSEPELPYTSAALAEFANVSVRCLQQEFRRLVGMPPMAYLRTVRIARAHTDLLHADPAATSVADVARRWGFARPDRFAAHYEARYGASPAGTLHGTDVDR